MLDAAVEDGCWYVAIHNAFGRFRGVSDGDESSDDVDDAEEHIQK